MKIKVLAEKEIYVEPCIKCGYDDILIFDGNESSFNYSVGRCKKCKHEITWDCSCLPNMEEMINHWNSKNNIDTVIATLKKEILALKSEIVSKNEYIDTLDKIQKERNLKQ